MSGYLLKPSDAPGTFVMDWARGYLRPGETLAADLGWSIQPSRIEAGDLTIETQAFDDRKSWARFADGVPGRFYMVSNRVRTTDDRTLSRGIVVRVAMSRSATASD